MEQLYFEFVDRPLCACGCGMSVNKNQTYKRWNKFIHGHHMRLPEARIRQREIGRKHLICYNKSDAHREYARELMVKNNADPEYRRKAIEASKGVPRPIKDPAVAERMKQNHKNLWKDDKWVGKMMEARAKGLNARPNKPESIVDKMSGSGIRYVGDRTWWRRLPNGIVKNPDFKVTGKRQVIEVFGNYWHSPAEAEMIIEMFHRVGYECLVIWESDINESLSSVKETIMDFIGDKNE